MRDERLLDNVTAAAKKLRKEREEIEEAARVWKARKMVEPMERYHQAIIRAVDNGHSITAVARALHPESTRTPNRNEIYAVLSQYEDRHAPSELPFEWAAREVETAAGVKTVYDIRGTLDGFGPHEVTGTFVWRYDVATRQPDQVLTDDEPYPDGDDYYQRVLRLWLEANPYPGQE